MQGRDGTTEYEEKTLVQSMKLLTEMNFEVDSSRQNIPSVGPRQLYLGHKRTLQIVGHLVSVDFLTLSIILCHSFSSMYIVLCISY